LETVCAENNNDSVFLPPETATRFPEANQTRLLIGEAGAGRALEGPMSKIVWRIAVNGLLPGSGWRGALIAARRWQRRIRHHRNFGSDNYGLGFHRHRLCGGAGQPSAGDLPTRRIAMCPTGRANSRHSAVADLNNANLTQFPKDGLKQSNDMVLKGFAMYARESRCWASGVPTYC